MDDYGKVFEAPCWLHEKKLSRNRNEEASSFKTCGCLRWSSITPILRNESSM